jgi:hypothetical protein
VHSRQHRSRCCRSLFATKPDRSHPNLYKARMRRLLRLFALRHNKTTVSQAYANRFAGKMIFPRSSCSLTGLHWLDIMLSRFSAAKTFLTPFDSNSSTCSSSTGPWQK